jgi:hypothetical protein
MSSKPDNCLSVEDEDAAKLLNSLRAPKKQNTIPRNAWMNFIKEVREEMSSKSGKSVSYLDAVAEASKRRRNQTNISNLNKIRKEKIETHRRSKEVIIDSDSEDENVQDLKSKIEYINVNGHNIQVVYNYKMMYKDKVVACSFYNYETQKDCLIYGLLDYTKNYSKYTNFTTFYSENFIEKVYREKFNDNLKLFFNSWFFEETKLVYDQSFKNLTKKVDSDLLSVFTIPELEYLCEFYKIIAVNQVNSYPYLLINKSGLVKS